MNTAIKIVSEAHSYFVKINQLANYELLKAELTALKLIENSGTIRVPKVISFSQQEQVYLVLEYFSLKPVGSHSNLAKSISRLHQVTQESFGLNKDNYIGLTRQINSLSENWVQFFAEYRLEFQLKLAKKNGLSNRVTNNGKDLIKNIEFFFTDYRPIPSLLHGDLWSGNYGFLESGEGVLFDPACYFGDHEADLAMMQLFSSPGEQFFNLYHQYFPIDAGFKQRKSLYNLYHILNHANIFGSHYFSQTDDLIKKLLRLCN